MVFTCSHSQNVIFFIKTKNTFSSDLGFQPCNTPLSPSDQIKIIRISIYIPTLFIAGQEARGRNQISQFVSNSRPLTPFSAKNQRSMVDSMRSDDVRTYVRGDAKQLIARATQIFLARRARNRPNHSTVESHPRARLLWH